MPSRCPAGSRLQPAHSSSASNMKGGVSACLLITCHQPGPRSLPRLSCPGFVRTLLYSAPARAALLVGFWNTLGETDRLGLLLWKPVLRPVIPGVASSSVAIQGPVCSSPGQGRPGTGDTHGQGTLQEVSVQKDLAVRGHVQQLGLELQLPPCGTPGETGSRLSL